MFGYRPARPLPPSHLRPIAGSGLPGWATRTEGSSGLTLNRLIVAPVPVPFPVRIDQIGIDVTAAQEGATPRLGLYAPGADGRPGELLVDAGTVDASSTGAKIIDLAEPVALTHGTVYIAAAWQGATDALRVRRPVSNGGNVLDRVPSNSAFILGATGGAWAYQGTASGALPGSGPTSPASDPNVPITYLRVESLL